MDNENKQDPQELGGEQTLIWNNNNEEKTQEFEELAGINKKEMENVISEINDNGSENEFSGFQKNENPEPLPTEENENINQEVQDQEVQSREEENQAEFFKFSSDDNQEENENQEIESPQAENELPKEQEEVISISKRRIALIRKLVNNIQENSHRVEELLSGNFKEEELSSIAQFNTSVEDEEEIAQEIGGKIIEGVFNGQCMIGPDGKQYNVPSNYASKSKLVEGDILKLTIDALGRFIYKQIGPIERNRIVGRLISGKNAEFFVEYEGRKWQILTASVTYFKGGLGDETIILVPKQGESNWAAVENIVNKS